MDCCCVSVDSSDDTRQGTRQPDGQEIRTKSAEIGMQAKRPDLIVQILGSLTQTRLPTWPEVKFYNALIELLETSEFSMLSHSDPHDRKDLIRILNKFIPPDSENDNKESGINLSKYLKIMEGPIPEDIRGLILQPLPIPDFKMRIPYVSIVVGNTICSTLNDVKQSLDDNIPVILIRGSGVTADIISKCLKISDTKTKQTSTETKLNERKFERSVLPLLTKYGIRRDEVSDTLTEISKNKLMIGQVDIRSAGYEALTETALELLHIARINEKMQKEEQEHVWLDESNNKGCLSRWVVELAVQDEAVLKNNGMKHILLHHALAGDMHDITESLVKNGVGMEDSDLNCLYHKFFKRKQNRPLWEIKDKRHKIEDILQEFIVEDLEEDYLGKYYDFSEILCRRILTNSSFLAFRRVFGFKDNPLTHGCRWIGLCILCLIFFCCWPCIFYLATESCNERLKNQRQGAGDFKCKKCYFNKKKGVDNFDLSFTETHTDGLLQWAVLTNNRKMADIFWNRSSDPIFLALLYCAILERLRERAIQHEEIKLAEELKDHSRLFCDRAIQITNRFYEMDPDLAIRFLTEKKKVSILKFEETPLKFAETYQIYDFLACDVAQQALNKVWLRTSKPCCSPVKKANQSICLKNVGWKFFRTYSPRSRWCIHNLLYLLFLICLSAMVLTDPLQTLPISWYEVLVRIWIVGDIVEEILPTCTNIQMHSLYMWIQIKNYFGSVWSWINMISYTLFIVGSYYRQYAEYSEHARNAYSILMFTMFIRCLHPLLVFKDQGQTIIMLQKALGMLLRYMPMLLIFIVSTGVFYHANLYPAHYDMFSPFGIQHWSFWKIFYLPYWQMYGDFKPELDGEGPTGCSKLEYVYSTNATIDRCPEKDWMVPVMSTVFFLLVNVVFLNLIIALFSFRFSEIKRSAKRYWLFNRSVVIMEFEHRLPVPLNIIHFILKPILCVVSGGKVCSPKVDSFQILGDELMEKQKSAARLCYDKVEPENPNNISA